MKRLIFICFGLLMAGKLLAQVYPVQSNLQITPPYSVNLPDYVAAGSDRMALNVMLTDVARAQLDVQLRFTIEGEGIRIETNPNYNPAPITLVSGFNNRLIASDLEPYFRAQNLVFRGMSAQQYINAGGALPEGVYRFCFEVLEFNRGVKISNTTCVTAWLILNDPPIINLPAMAEKLEPSDPQFVRFQWTPRHTGSPNSAFNTEYDFELVEVWPKGRNPNDAMLTTAPIYETTTFATSLVYGPSEPPLVRGRQYAFRVRAKSKVGIEQLDLFRNDGYSMVHSFTYGDECLPPKGFSIESVSSRKIQAYWENDGTHTSYKIRYRRQGDNGWTEEPVLFDDFTIEGLLPDTFYEVQLSGVCGFANSDLTSIESTKTQAEIATNFECGAPPEEFNLDNTTPLPSLQQGDVIYAGDFDISVIEVSGGNGTFSGLGQVVMPMMNNVKMGMSFANIKVNDEHRMYDGFMNFTGLTVQVLDDETLDEINNVFESIADFEEDLNDILDFSVEVMDSVNTIVETIQNTEVFTEEEYTEVISVENDAEDLKEAAKEAAEKAVQAVASGNIVEAAKQVAKSRSISKRAKQKAQQAVHSDTVQVAAVEFVSGGEGMDLGPGHLAIEPGYYKIRTNDGDKHGPWFSLKNGTTSTIVAQWIQSSQVPKDEIVFFLGENQVEARDTDDGWELDITAAQPEEEKVLKARYQGKTVGIAAVVTYKQESRNVVFVSVNGANTPTANEATDYLNETFGGAMVNWSVSTNSITIDDSWDLNGNDDLYLGENNDLSSYTDEAKALIRLAKSQLTVDNDKYYLLFTGTSNSLGADGYMPRKKQFGFIFSSSLQTIAHELGHGAFRLAHTWEEFPSLSEGDTQNLMDYGGGTNLRKYQWEQLHDPKWVVSFFDDEEEGAIAGQIWFTPDWKPFKVDSVRTIVSRVESAKVLGTIPGFKKEGVNYYAVFANDEFSGYYPSGDQTQEEYQIQAQSPEGSKAVFLFEDGGCGNSKYYQTTFSYVQQNKGLMVIANLNKDGKLIDCTNTNIDDLCEKGREYYESYETLSMSNTEKNFLFKVSELICEGNSEELIAAQLTQYTKWESRAKSISEIIAGNPFSFERYYNALVELKDWRNQGLALFTSTELAGFTKDEREIIREEIFEIAFQLDPSVLALLPLERKVKMLTVMMDGRLYNLFTSNHDALVVKLMKSVKSTEAAAFLDILVASEHKNTDDEPLIYQLKSKLNDFLNSSSPYTGFFKELRRLSDAKNALSGEKLDIKAYVKWDVEQKDYVLLSFVKNRNNFTFDYNDTNHTANIKTCVKQGRRFVYTGNSGYYEDYCEEEAYLLEPGSSPFSLIGLTIINDVSPLGAGCSNGVGSNEYCGQIQIVPALFLDYMQTKEDNQRLSNFGWNTFNVIITVATFGEGAAAISAIRAAQGAQKLYVAGKHAYTLMDFTYTVTDLTLKAADVNTPKWWSYVGYAFAAKTSYDLIKNGGAKGIGHLKKLMNEGKLDEALDAVNGMGVKKGDAPMTRNDLEEFVEEASGKINSSGNQDLINDYNNGLNGNIDLEGITYSDVLGKQISSLTEAPKGYEFYKVGDKEWIRRLDASNPDTPRLTVSSDGKIVEYSYSDIHTGLLGKLNSLSTDVPNLKRWTEGITNNAIFSKLSELDASALSKLEADLANDSLDILKGAFKEDPDLIGTWRSMFDKGLSDTMRRNPEVLKRTKSFNCN